MGADAGHKLECEPYVRYVPGAAGGSPATLRAVEAHELRMGDSRRVAMMIARGEIEDRDEVWPYIETYEAKHPLTEGVRRKLIENARERYAEDLDAIMQTRTRRLEDMSEGW